jgi:hypothetical protein
MGLGDFVTGIFGSENEFKAYAPKAKKKAYEYGGQKGYAQETADRYRAQAEQAQTREGVNVNYGQATQDRGLGLQARQGQASMANLMAQRASGQTPSISQMQADRQMQQANAAQASASASARGAAGMALAQQNAANNVSNQQSAISNQAQINAANERLQAEQAAMGAYSNLRGGDLASQQQSAQQAQYQASLQDSQRGRNDAMTLGMTQNEMGVQNTQLAAQMNRQAQKAANQLGAAQINAGVAGQNASTNQGNGMAVLGMGQSAAGAIAGGLADGGQMRGDQPKPYLVGERGPELVIPKKDGYVIPAELTAKMLAGKRSDGGPVDAPTSTWGVGSGVSQAELDRQSAADAANDARLAADRDARLATSGGMAIAGGPGSGATVDEPLRRADYETAALARARQAEGIELTPEEERKAAAAEYRQGNAKKNDRKAKGAEAKASLADFLTGSGNAWQKKAAAVDSSYHGPTGGYIPPQLIQIAGARAGGGPIDAGGGPTSLGELLSFGPVSGGPISAPLQGGQQMANPAGHGSALGRLALVHHMPSIQETNKATFKRPGPAALMAPGSGVATHGYGVGSATALAEGGPMDGADEVVPLYSPPGKWLQSTPEGRAYYIDEPHPLAERIDPTRPSLAKVMAPQPKDSPIAASAPVSLPPSQTKPKKMTEDELLAWANSLQKDMQSDHDKRMAQGPSVSLASRMGRR